MNSESDIIEENHVTKLGTYVSKRYQKLRFLGRGGFARCYEIKDLDTGKIFAIKVVDKFILARAGMTQKLNNEIDIHRSMNHKNIVKFESHFENGQYAYIVLELCPNQTLREMLKRKKQFQEIEARYFMAQLIEGIKYIHDQEVVHRDIKLDNLFIGKDMNLKIGDFGLAVRMSFIGQRRRTICGTPNYIAPEVLNARINGYSYECDLWSMGVVLYAMLVGKTPFETKKLESTYTKIKSRDYFVPDKAGVSSEAKDLISALLTLNPVKRPSLDTILSHPFMNKTPIPPQMPKTILKNAIPTSTYRSKSTDRRSFMLAAGEKQKINIKPTTAQAENHPDKAEEKIILKRRALKTDNYLKPPIVMQTPKQSKKNLLNGIKIEQITPIRNNTATKTTNKIKDIENVRRKFSDLKVDKEFNQDIQYVQYYHDYTDKYGLAYLLTNGQIGFYYNDMTNILWHEQTKQYEYANFYTKGDKIEIKFITTSTNDKDIEKKLKIFNCFKAHCEKRMDSLIKITLN